MIEIATITLTAIAAIAAVLGLLVAYLNHHARLQSELPKVAIYHSDIYKGEKCFSFKIIPGFMSMYWDVIRVTANKSDGSPCQLAPTTGEVIEWYDLYEYEQPTKKGELLIRGANADVWLSFVCRAPLRWWKRWQWWKNREERNLLPVHYNPLWAFPLTMSSEK